MDDIDRRILAFIGAHWFVLAAHVQAFLGVEEEENADRLRGLEAGGLVRSERLLRGRASSVRITGAGLEAIGSLLPAPGFDLGGYRHEVAVVWLWVAAWRGAFGEAERVLSRREMQGVDRAARDAGGEASGFAVSLPARGGSGSPGLCYPDVGLVVAAGRVPLHLPLRLPGPGELEALLAGYRSASGFAGVVFVVEEPGVGEVVRAAAARLGMARLCMSSRRRSRPRIVSRGSVGLSVGTPDQSAYLPPALQRSNLRRRPLAESAAA